VLIHRKMLKKLTVRKLLARTVRVYMQSLCFC